MNDIPPFVLDVSQVHIRVHLSVHLGLYLRLCKKPYLFFAAFYLSSANYCM